MEKLKLAEELPQVMQSLQQLKSAVITDGALDAKQKELIAIGISVAIRCSPCITHHLKNALQMGITSKEIVEAISVAILMGGGPAAAYANEAVNLLNELTDTR